MEKKSFDISGMSCAACSAAVQRAVEKLDGVKKAGVNLLANSMSAEYDPLLVSPGAIIEAVTKAGYGASLKERKLPARPVSGQGAERGLFQAEARSMKQRLIVSFAFLAPLMYVSMGHMAGLPLPGFLAGTENALSFCLTQFLLCLPVALVNRGYYRNGFKALLRGNPNMDSLIALGSGAALLYGVCALYLVSRALGHGEFPAAQRYAHDLYFESAAMILTLISLGKTLEAVSKKRTGAAIEALMDLTPKSALLLRDGLEYEIPLEDVRPGDTLAVKPGARVPADGILLNGSAALDESAITGESLPVEKGPGGKLTGGTVNSGGYFTMKAERVGDDTTLAQIIALVEEAGASKAPIAKLADRISGVFVPFVIAAALLSFAVWLFSGQSLEFALTRAISVLIISCPCALGLATPVAIMVGTGRGAKNGILYKDAGALENLSRIDTVVLDKTGTVTEGKPRLTDILPFGMSENELLALAAGMEAASEHPVAHAVTREARDRNITAAAFDSREALSGLGLRAKSPDGTYLAGNRRLMKDHSVDLDEAEGAAARLAGEGKTPLYFARNGRLAGIIAVADLPRQDSAAAVAALRGRGLRVLMLTGDNAVTAGVISRAVGIDEALAEVLPRDKDAELRRLMDEGHKVAMIGDGINDAPALARAEVGIAIGAGTDVAIESADVVLMKNSLEDAVTAYDLSKATLRTIRMNLFWAFFYNILGIPVAAGLLYPAFGLTLNPMIGAAAMSLSSVFVVLNALGLNFFKPRPAPRDIPRPIGSTGGPSS